jgi:hypothetical protein
LGREGQFQKFVEISRFSILLIYRDGEHQESNLELLIGSTAVPTPPRTLTAFITIKVSCPHYILD